MAERDTAEHQLERILYLLPAAAREEGAGLEELAKRLQVSPKRVLRDLETVTDRVFYHPSGGADDLQILLEVDRVKVRTGNKFQRPTKLTPREMLALHLGLRMVGAERPSDEVTALAQRLEAELAVTAKEDFLPRFSVEDGTGGGGEIRALLFQAARERCRCRITYLKPEAEKPEERCVDPYMLVRATGHWYVLGHCAERDAVRAFRLDRVVAAEVLPEFFETIPDFDPTAYLEGGWVYRADEEMEVLIRYSPRIARWMTERGWGMEEADGSVVISHRVADPGWAVRHVLQYGPEAEVLEPPEIRGLVGEVVERMVQ